MLQQAVTHKPNIPTDMKKPLFPASDPATRSFNGLHPKSKFLTITLKLKRQVTSVALLPSLLFILTLLLALSPVGWAATVNVNTVAQLVNAVNNGA